MSSAQEKQNNKLESYIFSIFVAIRRLLTLGLTIIGIFSMLQPHIKKKRYRLIATFILLNLINLTPKAAFVFIFHLPKISIETKISIVQFILRGLNIIANVHSYPVQQVVKGAII